MWTASFDGHPLARAPGVHQQEGRTKTEKVCLSNDVSGRHNSEHIFFSLSIVGINRAIIKT